jgi:hypothetical protein
VLAGSACAKVRPEERASQNCRAPVNGHVLDLQILQKNEEMLRPFEESGYLRGNNIANDQRAELALQAQEIDPGRTIAFAFAHGKKDGTIDSRDHGKSTGPRKWSIHSPTVFPRSCFFIRPTADCIRFTSTFFVAFKNGALSSKFNTSPVFSRNFRRNATGMVI